jgi:hypothetical protein
MVQWRDVPLFCRHNRFEQNCPICSKEKEAERRASRSARVGAPRRAGSPATPARKPRLVTRKIARAVDDGYRNDLVPGLKATADAERLAACLTLATQRLEFPGPYPEVAEEADVEVATMLAFTLTVEGDETLIAAYRAWIERHGTQERAIVGEASWNATRRFARAFERLSVKGISRAHRYDFLAVLGAAGTYELEADALHPAVGADATTVAAKRALVSGETMLLERRAKALAVATGVPIAALDKGLAAWDSTDPVEAPEGELYEQVLAALGV